MILKLTQKAVTDKNNALVIFCGIVALLSLALKTTLACALAWALAYVLF